MSVSSTSKYSLALNRYFSFEQSVADATNRLHHYPALRETFAFCSRFGDGIGWYTLMAILLVWYGWDVAMPIVHVLATSGVGVLIYSYIKKKTQRLRPCDTFTGLQTSVAPLDKYSFPSGHTLHAASFGIMLVHYFPETAFFVIPMSLMIAMSRMVLALHYLSDVLVGAAIGTTLAVLSLYAFGM